MSAGYPERPLFALVEDEPVMAKLVCDMLATGDAEVEVFSLEKSLLQSANQAKFKAIILDMPLSGLDGFCMMDKLAGLLKSSSVLLRCGHGSAVLHAAKLYGSGVGLMMIGALTKPFTRNDLILAYELSQ